MIENTNIKNEAERKYQDLVAYLISKIKDAHYEEHKENFDTFAEYCEWAYGDWSEFKSSMQYLVNERANELYRTEGRTGWWMDKSTLEYRWITKKYSELKRDIVKENTFEEDED